MPWTSTATPPELTIRPGNFRFESRRVLGVCRDGKRVVVFACRDEDERRPDGPVRWVSDCSEGWDVTGYVLYWQDLPPIDCLVGVTPTSDN